MDNLSIKDDTFPSFLQRASRERQPGAVPGVRAGPLSGWLGTISRGEGEQELEMR